jgi:hypothetical protein
MATLHSGKGFWRGDQGTPFVSKVEKASANLFATEGKRVVTLAIAWFLNLDKESLCLDILFVLMRSFASGLVDGFHNRFNLYGPKVSW